MPQHRASIWLNVEKTVGFEFLKSILPFASIACLCATVWSYSRTPPMPAYFSLYLFFLGIAYFGIWYFWKPRSSSTLEGDWVSLIVFCAAAFGNMMGAINPDMDSVVSCSAKLALASFVFVRTPMYVVYLVFALGGQVLARHYSGLELDYRYQTLLVLGPLYAASARLGIRNLQTRIATAYQELHTKIDELQSEKLLREDAEQQLLQAQKLEGLGLLAAGVAHDFNNHLQAIKSFASLIEIGDKSDDYPRLIQSATSDAAGICRQMLAYAGRTQDELTVLNATKAMTHMRAMIKPLVPGAIELTFRIASEELFVRSSKTVLQQCVTNLVRNSMEAISSAEGSIRVGLQRIEIQRVEEQGWLAFGDFGRNEETGFSWRECSSAIAIEVIDDGCGMDPATLQKAFDPYFTTKATGHGFGLSTTLGIVRSMNGLIRCRSSPGAGTEIQILLPERSADDQDLSDSGPLHPLKSMRRILVVDDEQFVRTSMAKLLQKSGFFVRCVDSAKDALKVLRSHGNSFDVLLLDYAMPTMNGLELLDLLRTRGIKTPAILCSGYTEESIENREGVRPDAFLAKPIGMRDLLKTLKEIQHRSLGVGE